MQPSGPLIEKAAAKRVLFFAEAVTLAHVARPLALGEGLASTGWGISLACDPRYRQFLAEHRGGYHELSSIEPTAFLDALSRGAPVYKAAMLERYVDDDLRAIAAAKPDVVVGDFRLSLSVSARLAKVPYVALANAYWSPYYEPAGWPVPQLGMTRLLPIVAAEALFRLARRAAFALHSRPLNQVRRRYGLSSLGSDLRRVYTDADYVAYVDGAELFPIRGLPSHHSFVGPVLWEPRIPLPGWWNDLPSDRPIVYVSLGSSGQARLLPTVVAALAASGASTVVATAGRSSLENSPPSVHVERFLPGNEVAKRASLVICNGGSLACYQALAAGVPIIGIASNLDQFLNMQAIQNAGAGATVRADRATEARIRATAMRVLKDRRFADAARSLAHVVNQAGAQRRFAELLTRALGRQPCGR
jgi:UDP:flavonoid glycosyltransferase YjiC (YdhE family)